MTNYEPPAVPVVDPGNESASVDPWAEYEVVRAIQELTDVANEHRQQTGHRVHMVIDGPLSVNIRCTTCHPLGLRTPVSNFERPPGNVYQVDDPELIAAEVGPGERPTVVVDGIEIQERVDEILAAKAQAVDEVYAEIISALVRMSEPTAADAVNRMRLYWEQVCTDKGIPLV